MIENMIILILCILGGAIYSTFFWLKKWIDPTKTTEKFEVTKLLATMCFGAFIGLVIMYGRIPVSQLGEWLQLFLYTALSGLSREIGVTAYRRVKK